LFSTAAHEFEIHRQAGSVRRAGYLAIVAGIALMAMSLAGSRTGSNAHSGTPSSRMSRFPRVMLWAWERREDLSFIDPREVGVAYLARTIYLNGDRVVIRPRQQPLIVPRNSIVVAVVRIEADWRDAPTLSSHQRAETARAIARVADSAPAAIQIDFDATRSQRAFYRDLLIDLRGRLPASMPLTITSLASWSIYDDWIADLPIDEAVPMLFRMGSGTQEITAYLRGGGDFGPALSRQSVGIALDEPEMTVPAGRRIYMFSPRAWTRGDANKAIAEVAK
jgi:hypothetical protein